MTAQEVTCASCRQLVPVAVPAPDGGLICFDCLPEDARTAVVETMWSDREQLASRVRAVLTATKLVGALASASPADATVAISEMSPADYRQVFGALALRVLYAETALDMVCPGGSAEARRQTAELLVAASDHEADMFAALEGARG